MRVDFFVTGCSPNRFTCAVLPKKKRDWTRWWRAVLCGARIWACWAHRAGLGADLALLGVGALGWVGRGTYIYHKSRPNVGKQLGIKSVITPIYPIYNIIPFIGGSNHQPVVKIGVSEGQPNSPLRWCEVLKQDSQTSDPHKV